MNCQRAERLFSPLLDGELAPAEKTSIEAHFEACPSCMKAYQEFVHTLDMVHSLPRLEAPEDFADSVLDRVRSRAPVTVDPWWRRLGWQVSDWTEWLTVRPAYATAAAMVLVVVGAFAVWQVLPGGEPGVVVSTEMAKKSEETASPDDQKDRGDLAATPEDEAPDASAVKQMAERGELGSATETSKARDHLEKEDAPPRVLRDAGEPKLVRGEASQSVPDSLFDHEYDFDFALDRYYFQRLPGDSGLTPARPFPETKGRPASITF
jgi:hypothetical protein